MPKANPNSSFLGPCHCDTLLPVSYGRFPGLAAVRCNPVSSHPGGFRWLLSNFRIGLNVCWAFPYRTGDTRDSSNGHDASGRKMSHWSAYLSRWRKNRREMSLWYESPLRLSGVYQLHHRCRGSDVWTPLTRWERTVCSTRFRVSAAFNLFQYVNSIVPSFQLHGTLVFAKSESRAMIAGSYLA